MTTTVAAYNYAAFDACLQEFFDFAVHAPKVTMRAPSFTLEDLVSGQSIEMADLWKDATVVVEFGSFT